MMDKIIAHFKEKKLKLTPQRLAVYNYLVNTDTHPSAETIYNALQTDYPTMSLATVYKALKTLTEVGFIQELNVGEGNFRYDGNPVTHPHLQCIKCEKVADFDDFSLDYLNQEAEKHSSFKILSHQIYFYGVCPDCNCKE